MIRDAGERLHRVWHRQQIVEEPSIVRRPGQMFREQTRRITSDELLEALKMIPVERPIGADRQSDAVERQRIAFANCRQIAVRRTSRAHVIFSMDLKETDVGQGFDNGAVMLGLEADAGSRRNEIPGSR